MTATIICLVLVGLAAILVLARRSRQSPPPDPVVVSLHQAVAAGELAAIEAALNGGVEVNAPGHAGKTPLMTAIDHERLDAFELLLARGADPDLTNDFNQTALHVAVGQDWLPAVEQLIAQGCDLGRNPKYPLKTVHYGNLPLPNYEDMPAEFREVMSESEMRKSLKATAASMKELGRNPTPEPVIADAASVPVLRLLLAHGEVLSDADAELRRAYVGLPESAPIDATAADFRRSRHPAFGTANPERFDDPFCLAMIRSGRNAYAARQKFEFADDYSQPIWCYDRFGHSLTELPDGRFVGIGGEHEDYYDPDFYIYNDVVVHDGKGGISLYRYPKESFPSTDFHTATLVGQEIIIIGSLGYGDARDPHTTPVFRLSLDDFSITPLQPTGNPPGWISRHRAVYDESAATITISGGERWDGDDLVPFAETATLSLHDKAWQ